MSNFEKALLVTGSSGGIGSAIVTKAKKEGFFVIGLDIVRDVAVDLYMDYDLSELVNQIELQQKFQEELQQVLSEKKLVGLVNNAAVQQCNNFEELDISEFKLSIEVNLMAPLLLIKLCYALLKQTHASVVNISSIHATLTKPGFISYATSKGGMEALTRALAIDIGSEIRINAVAPAATNTKMLHSGFKGDAKQLNELSQFHPCGRIAEPDEIADVVLYLIAGKAKFINGAVIDISGGIASRLHDPI